MVNRDSFPIPAGSHVYRNSVKNLVRPLRGRTNRGVRCSLINIRRRRRRWMTRRAAMRLFMNSLQKTGILALFVFLAAANSFGQKADLDSLSNELRDSFQSRLNRYIEYEIKQEWSKMFSLSTDYISNEKIPFLAEERITQKDFVEKRNSTQNIRLLRFVLSGISLINGSANETEWLVDGCGEFMNGEKRSTLKTAIDAVHYNDDWYFSDIRFSLKGVGKNQEIKCKIPKAQK